LLAFGGSGDTSDAVMENPMWISSHMSLSSFLAFIGLILEILVSRSRNSDCMAKSATVLAANDEL
jgi:hypothetical protein